MGFPGASKGLKMTALRTAVGVLAAFFGITALAAAQGTTPGISDIDFSSYYTNKYGYDQSKTLLGRGVNMGNIMEAGEGDGIFATGPIEAPGNGEGSWSGGKKAEASDFALIKSAGFKSVRIPMKWSLYTSKEEPYTVNPLWVARTKQVVDQALAEGLIVVMNVHHYKEMFDLPSTMPQDKQRKRLMAIWTQIKAAFPEGEIKWEEGKEPGASKVNVGGYPKDKLVFELLNEPNGKVTNAIWNDIIAELVKTIRGDQPGSPAQANRYIMIGAGDWNAVKGLASLRIPSGCTPSNTIITVHCYEPIKFTHQGASWVKDSKKWLGTRWTGTEEDIEDQMELFKAIKNWNSGFGRGFEMFLGEFGVFVYRAGKVQLDDQKRWTAFMAREAEHIGMSWGYWEFNQAFGVYDLKKKDWKPTLLEALMTNERGAAK